MSYINERKKIMARKYKLDIYKGNKIIKTVEAEGAALTFGVIKGLSKIIKLDGLKSTSDVSKACFEAMDGLVEILSMIFPDMTEEDWDGVQIKDMIDLILELSRTAVTEALMLPTDGKAKNR